MSEAACEKVLSMDEPHSDGAIPAAPDSSSKLAPNFAAAAQPSYARTLFFGQDGLRPGWGFAFYVLLFFLLQRLLNVPVQGLLNVEPGWSPRLVDAIQEAVSLIAASIPAVVLGRIEKRGWGVFGLPLRFAFGRLFWLGALWGFAGITLLMLMLYGLHDFDYGRLALHGLRVAKLGVYWAALFLLVGLFEEFLLRGYTQYTLARGIGFWSAAFVLSATFGFTHLFNEGEQWRGLLAAGAIGLFFCLTLRRTGSLWFAVGFHAAWDWGQTFFYSVPDSGLMYPHQQLLRSSLHGSPWLTGGSVGPEGSVLCLFLIVVVGMAFDRVFPAQRRDPAGDVPIPD